MKKRFQLLALSVLCVAFARAQYVDPTEGVFRIVNKQFGTARTENMLEGSLSCTAIGDDDDCEQFWILKQKDSSYSLQNVLTGRYIQTGSSPFRTGESGGTFNIVPSKNYEDCYNIWDQNETGLHCDNSSNIVRWHSETTKAASEWCFVSISVTEELITAAREQFRACMEETNKELVYQAILDTVFVDSACTRLSDAYAVKTVEELKSELSDQLPTALMDLIIKVKTGEWAEANEKADKPGWDGDYAEKFRVQMIEPHSIAGEITQWLGINEHSNMDNPTGIYANKCEAVYIMVEGKIEEGAELWFNTLTGHNISGNHARGRKLHEGLNIVPLSIDGSAMYLDYVVHTYDPKTKKFPHKLSEYSKLKVNIAGGYINGYYNAYGDELYTADTDTDWMYYEDRANLEIITILGRYQILHFELNDVAITAKNEETGQMETTTYDGLAKLFPERLPQELPDNQRINAIVEGWDRLMLSQMMAFGVAKKEVVDSMNIIYPRWDATWKNKAEIFDYEGYADFCGGRDYSEYFNHHGVAYGTRSGFMSAGGRWCNYHINTTTDILVNIVTGGDAWGPSHEIGHQHQSIFTLNGEMEVTNNFFSNISNWYIGLKTSRMAESQGNLENVYNNFKEGGDLYGNNIWALTHRYYRLWLYYHRAGYNTQFYPRLFELLRQNPMQRTNGSGGQTEIYNEKEKKWETVGYGNTDGKNSLLHFYKLCCDAAQEDLTEFFRAYGYFTPMKDRFVGDYSNSMYYQTQEDIDEAIAEVKAKGYPVNNLPLFINDCTKETTYRHDGKTPRYFFNWETGMGWDAEVGLYVDYLKNAPVSGEYIYTLENLKLSISGGQGAVGFAIYNKEGEIQAFSNNHSFSLNKKTAALLRSGEGTLYAVAADGNDVVIKNKILIEPAETQLAALKEAYDLAVSYLERTDTTGRKVGYLIPDSVQDFSSLVTQVEGVIKNEDTSVHTYGEWYLMMDAAIATVQNSSKVRVPFIPYSFYSLFLTNSDVVRYMDNANAGLRFIENKEEGLADNLQWKLVATETGDSYYIQHRASGKFITTIKSGQRVKAESTDVTKAVAFNLVPDLPGSFLLQCVNDENMYLYNYVSNTNNYVYAGNKTDANAKWNIQLEDDLLGMPETSENDSITIYHLLRTDNGEYAYSYMPNSPRNRGRITTGALNDKDDENFWFYFKQGEEGTYTMYNFATKLPVSISDGNLFTNKEVETTPEYTIELNEQGTGLVISAAEGTWFINDSVEYAVVSVNDQTDWKLQRAQTIDVSNAILSSLTMTKERVTLTEGDSIVLTVITAPEYAADHSVTWSSSDTTIAIVDSTGMVKAIAAGSATITATANDASGLTATCKITVKKGEAGIFTTATSTLSVQSRGGLIVIDGLAEGTEVAVYSIVGKQIAAITTTGGTTTIDTGLTKGSTIIVKVGGDNFKVSLQ